MHDLKVVAYWGMGTSMFISISQPLSITFAFLTPFRLTLFSFRQGNVIKFVINSVKAPGSLSNSATNLCVDSR